jgi:hypothetical protein
MAVPSPRALGFGVLLIAVASPAGAWTDATRVRMLKDALKVTPPALNAILERYGRDLERGVLVPSRRETEEVHYQIADGSSGLAAAAVAAKEAEARSYLQKKHGLRRFAFEMGVIAHLIADVCFPLNVSDADAREPLYREAYRGYIERSLARIPYVLDRAPTPLLDRGDIEAHLMESARRAGKNYALIGPAFKDDGTPRSPQALDERSVPFGIASLAYSEAVNDIVRIWTHLWRAADGDMSGGPFQEKAVENPRPAGVPE